MNFAPLGRLFVVIFGVLGLALEARIVFSHPEQWSDVAALWTFASLSGKLAMVAGFVVPLSFYSFCIATCFIRLPKRFLVASTGVVALASLPVFLSLSGHYPTIAKNAIWTALCWSFVFAELYAKPNGVQNNASDAEIDEDPQPDSEASSTTAK